MSMAVKWVGGLAIGTLLLAGSQLIRERNNPDWTSAARSMSAPETERARASTPVAVVTPSPVSEPPSDVREFARAGARYRPFEDEHVGIAPGRDVRAEPLRFPAVPDEKAIDARAAPVGSRVGAVERASVDKPLAPAVDSPAPVARTHGRLRKVQPRRPSLRFAGRSNGCGSRCSARFAKASLPTRRNPIQFRLADRGSR